jgi:hypothetical protein
VDFYDDGVIVSADGGVTVPLNGAVVVVIENGRRSYYDLSGVLDTIVTSCGRFMLDQSMLEEPDARVKAAAGEIDS